MKFYDPFTFLVGSRSSIERIAGSYWSILIGLLLVLSAGIARNYDHMDLSRNLEWVYGPILASIVSCLIIYAFGMRRVRNHPDSKLSFLSFLSVYWMTAPCAWIYGIPVESIYDIITATKWNMAFLAIVSIWRVALMIRCLMVLTEMKFIWAFLSIFLPASFVSLVGSFFKGISLVGIMGGVRLPPETILLKDAADFTFNFSLILFVVLLILKAGLHTKQPRQYLKPLPWTKRPSFPASSFVICLCLIIAGLCASTVHQSKIKNTEELRRLLHKSDLSEAFQFLSDKDKDDFSLIHDFPPSTQNHSSFEGLRNLMQYPSSAMPGWARNIWYRDYTWSLLSDELRIVDLVEYNIENQLVSVKLKQTQSAQDENFRERIDFKLAADGAGFSFTNHNNSYVVTLNGNNEFTKVVSLSEGGKTVVLWPVPEKN